LEVKETVPKYRIGILDKRLSTVFFRSACEMLDAILIDDVTEDQIRNGLQLDLCIVTGEYFPEQVLFIAEARRLHIPVLHVVDGILEWRNTWEHPQLTSPLLQPVLADKIACLGKSQARILESWGNYGKCEVVGSPRHDGLLEHKQPEKGGDEFVLLVCSARTPYFNSSQKEKVTRSFIELQKYTRQFSESIDIPIKILWRLNEELFNHLNINDAVNSLDANIIDLLDVADAMITTPSTLILEAMLYGIPVCTLDYTNSPQYVQTAWTITAGDHFPEVLKELYKPPDARLLLQDYYLHDSLECQSPAGPRLTLLIEKMLFARVESKKNNIPMMFPDSILDQEKTEFHLPEQKFNLTRLYPNHPVYSDYDKSALQSELLHCRKKIEEQSSRIQQMDTYGVGSLVPRLVYVFPSVGKMRVIFSLWWKRKVEKFANKWNGQN